MSNEWYNKSVSNRFGFNKFFSISLNESTNVTSQARLAVLVRFSCVNIINEGYLILTRTSTKTTGQDIMNEVLKNSPN